MKEPVTPEQWQEAVDQAEFWLTLESARQYGLIAGGPGVDVVRCEQVLERGRARGIRPRSDAIERCVAAGKAQGWIR